MYPLFRMLGKRLRRWLRGRSAVGESAASATTVCKSPSSCTRKGGAMETSFENLVRFFETEGLKHRVDHDPNVVTAGFQADNLSVRVYFVLEAESGLLQLFAPLPTKVPEGCRPAIAEAITRANYGMKLGTFEMDLADGGCQDEVDPLGLKLIR